ncbi:MULTISPECIES: hypothetical protein [Methylobacterium]|uniref:hypothetical protein n=1 Tax=Methylobacterium TaxID=407 RepID=UPI002F35DD55
MRNSIKAALFVTAFSPALVSLGVARMLPPGDVWAGAYYVLAGLIGCLLVVYIISSLKYYGEEFPFIAKKIESYDALMLGLVSTYILPFFIKAGEISGWGLGSLLAVASIFAWVSDAIIPSPLMRILSYRFYKVESANGVVYTLITNNEVLDPKQVTAVKRISGSMLLEVGR